MCCIIQHTILAPHMVILKSLENFGLYEFLKIRLFTYLNLQYIFNGHFEEKKS